MGWTWSDMSEYKSSVCSLRVQDGDKSIVFNLKGEDKDLRTSEAQDTLALRAIRECSFLNIPDVW